jgi:hypothetical protein
MKRTYKNVRLVSCEMNSNKFTYSNEMVVGTVVRADGTTRDFEHRIQRRYGTDEIEFKSLIEDAFPQIHNMK